MKTKIYISLLSASIAGLTASCELDAPSVSALDAQSICSNVTLADAAVMGIHQSFGETNSYRGRFLPYYGLNTDIEWINSNDGTKLPDENKYDLCTYAATGSNGQMNTENNAYAKFYEGIERANQIIVGLREYGDVDNNADMAQLLGEALTLRAYVYLDLIKGWGDVPARFEPITSETLYLPRTNRDVIYKQLLADLEEAENLVGWPNENDFTQSVERVSKSFVKGFRARVALYAGGYSQRADGVRLSTDSELDRTAMYQIALKECKEVIEAGYNTLGEFKDNFTNLCLENTKAGNESLFEIPFSDGRGRVLYTFGIKHNAKDQYTQQAQGGVNGPLPTLFYDFDVDDARRDITCIPYEWSKDLSANGNAKQEPTSLKKWCFGKLRYEWMSRVVTSTNDDGINWQVMRLADVYLMAAEAENELNGPANAWQYMEPVLNRVLPASKVAALQAKYTASKEAFFAGVVDQRAFEFAGEMLRKADLIRWNKLSTNLSTAREKMWSLLRREGNYADLPTKIYYKYEKNSDGDDETLVFYGLNHGETDAEGKALCDADEAWTSTTWIDIDENAGASKLGEYINGMPGYIYGLYGNNDPDAQQFWPIWDNFVSASNGTLQNYDLL